MATQMGAQHVTGFENTGKKKNELLNTNAVCEEYINKWLLHSRMMHRATQSNMLAYLVVMAQ